MEKNSVIFLFQDDKYDLAEVETYSIEKCHSYEEPMPLKEFGEFYNSPDNYSDWGTDFYIRIFTFGKNVNVYIVTEESSCPVTYPDGCAGSFEGSGYFFDDDEHDFVSIDDVPVQVLDELCECTSFVKKLSVQEYEKLHNNQDWPLYVTFREVEISSIL